MRTKKEIMGDMSQEEFSIGCLDFQFFAEHVMGLMVKSYHLEWIDFIMNNRRVAIECATGFGKTEILGRAFFLWISSTMENKEMCIVSKTLPQAGKVLSEIKDYIENNEWLEELIPKDKPRSNWCSASVLPLSTGCKIFCRPYSENIKGIHVDYLIGDEVSSYEDYEIWYRFVVTRTNAKNGTVVAISTPDNMADLMQELLSNPEYVGGSYPAIKNGKSIWPEHFPMDKLMRIKNEIGIAAFEREYLCNPKAAVDNALYPAHILNECIALGTGFSMSAHEGFTVVGCDFAIADGPRADFDSYIVVNKLGAKATILHGETHKGMSIAAKVLRLKDLYQAYRKTYEEKTKDGKIVEQTASTIKFILDPSNVGAAVYEELRTAGIPCEAANFDAVNRNAMLINLRQMMENKDLIIPRDKEDPLCMNFVDNKLLKELLSIIETRTPGGQITYKSKAPHDDTVMALAMACHGVSKQKDFMDFMAF